MDSSVGQVPYPKPINNNKPKQKLVFKWQSIPSQPTIPSIFAQNQTHPHSKAFLACSFLSPKYFGINNSFFVGSDKTDVEPTSTHIELTCTEKLLSVINNSDAFVDEFLCSDAYMDESLCSDGDVALQCDIQRIIHEHTDNVIKKWGDRAVGS